MTFTFKEQLAIGEAGEEVIERFLSGWYDITPASMDGQRAGYDRVLKNKKTGVVVTCEIKTDHRAGDTGNAFVELNTGRPGELRGGWANKSAADFLAYYVPSLARCYWVRMERVRNLVWLWQLRYPGKECRNADGFNAWGLPVPLSEFAKIAEDVIELGGDSGNQ